MQFGLTARHACRLAGISTASLYRTPAVDRNGVLRERLRAVWRANMGYRTAHGELEAEFAPLNLKRVYRIWRQEKLGRVKRYRKKRTGQSIPFQASGPNQVWCLDFCFDSCMNGSRLKILAVKDEFTRECLALEVATRLRSIHVQKVLAELIRERGAPTYLRSDNGSEFISRLLAVFLARSGTQSRFIKPGSPWQNGHAESFMSRFRAECLDVEVFVNPADAQVKIAVYRRFYNEQRRHSSLGRRTPSAFAEDWKAGRATPSLVSNLPVLTSKEGEIYS